MEAEKCTGFFRKVIRRWERCFTNLNCSDIMTCKKLVLGPGSALILSSISLSSVCPLEADISKVPSWIDFAYELSVIILSYLTESSSLSPDEISLMSPGSVFPTTHPAPLPGSHCCLSSSFRSAEPELAFLFYHTLLWLGSQLPLTVLPSTQPPRPDPFSTLVPESEKLEIRSRYCLLNPSVTLDHLQNYAQTSSHRTHPNPTEVWPLLARQAPHFFPASISPSSTVPLSSVLPLLPKLKFKPRN